MSTAALRHLAISVIVASLLAFSACGTNSPKVCNAANCCGPSSDACVAPRFLYAAGISGQVSVFPVSGNGTLGSPTSTTGPTMTLGMAALNSQFLYVSDFQNAEIDAWTIKPGTGALTAVQGSPFTLGLFSLGAGLAANNTADVLYVADAAKIDALKADATGALTAVSGSPFPAGTNLFLALDPTNQFLFASEDTPPGNVLAFTVEPSTGALTAVPGSPFPTDPNAVANTRPFGIVVDSTSSFVYTALETANQVAAFSIVKPSGALNPVPGSPFAAGTGPITLTTAKNFLYVANGLDGTISGYSINPANGVLTPLSNSPFAIRGAALTTDPSGSFFYAASSGGMLAFSIDSTTGALTPIGSPIPYPGAAVLTFVQ